MDEDDIKRGLKAIEKLSMNARKVIINFFQHQTYVMLPEAESMH